MEYIISGVWVGLELSCAILFNGAFLTRRDLKNRPWGIILLIWGVVCVYTNLSIDQLLKQILLVAVYSGISRMLYQGSWITHISLAIVCYVFIAAVDALSVNGICNLLGISYEIFTLRKLSYITFTTMEKLVLVFSAWLLYRVRKNRGFGKLQSRWLLLSVLYPTISVIMFLMFFYQEPRDRDISVVIVAFSGILMVANIASLYMIDHIERETEREQDVRLLRQQIDLQTENYNALIKNYSVQRKSTHEFERHIQTLYGLLEQDEFDAVKNYVHQLQKDRTLKVFSIHTNNPILDVVLNQKHQRAQESGITMRVQVNDLSAISIQANKLVVMLSNLLDNALEGCVRSGGHKEIVCTILAEEDIYISIRNTSEPVTLVNGEITSSKANPTEHGYGIPAVKYILEQLDAEYTFSYQDGWFQFVAEIPISNT